MEANYLDLEASESLCNCSSQKISEEYWISVQSFPILHTLSR